MSSTPATTTTAPITASYWCYSCTRFVSIWADQGTATVGGVACPHCDGGFIEEINDSSTPAELAIPASSEVRSINNNRRSVIRRRRSGRRPSFNPVIVLQGGASEREEENGARDRRAFEFYYDDGSGSGLRPLPDSVSEILMGSGFERLLVQLSQIEASANGLGTSGNPPASKSAIESLPRVEISDCHISAEANCAVCTEVFEAETEAREMPCKHIFHDDCIVPWLSIRNSCPVCRFELPSEPNRRSNNEEENAVGMTIWRLPGGGFAVGRFNAAMRDGERVLPVVLTEMDGGRIGNTDGPRRISWVRSHGTLESASNGSVSSSGSGGRLKRMVRGMVSLMRRARPNRGSSSSTAISSSPTNSLDLNIEVESRVLDRSNSVLRRYFRRNRSNRDSSSVLH